MYYQAIHQNDHEGKMQITYKLTFTQTKIANGASEWRITSSVTRLTYIKRNNLPPNAVATDH